MNGILNTYHGYCITCKNEFLFVADQTDKGQVFRAALSKHQEENVECKEARIGFAPESKWSEVRTIMMMDPITGPTEEELHRLALERRARFIWKIRMN